MPPKREKKKNLWQSGGVKDMKDYRSRLGMFAGVGSPNEKPSICVVKKCPVHESSNHTLQGCRKFVNITVDEKERIILSNKMRLFCLSPGHRLSQHQAKSKC